MAKAYLIVIVRTILFYAKRHPYMACWDVVWLMFGIWHMITDSFSFAFLLMLVMILIPIGAKRIYRKMDEFASPGVQGRHLREKIEEREQLKKYLEKSYTK